MNRYQQALLVALNQNRRHIYGGTVPAAEVARRRRKDKAAKAARKIARGNR